MVARMPKQPRVDKRPAGITAKEPAARPVWLLLGLAAVVLAAMTRKAYGGGPAVPLTITEAGRRAREG